MFAGEFEGGNGAVGVLFVENQPRLRERRDHQPVPARQNLLVASGSRALFARLEQRFASVRKPLADLALVEIVLLGQ